MTVGFGEINHSMKRIVMSNLSKHIPILLTNLCLKQVTVRNGKPDFSFNLNKKTKLMDYFELKYNRKNYCNLRLLLSSIEGKQSFQETHVIDEVI